MRPATAGVDDTRELRGPRVVSRLRSRRYLHSFIDEAPWSLTGRFQCALLSIDTGTSRIHLIFVFADD